MTILAALLVSKLTCEPFLVGHLFRELSHDLTAGSQGLCDERVACGAKLGFANVLALGRPISAGRRPHNSVLSVFNLVGTILGALPFCLCGIDNEATCKALSGTEFFLRDLVTNRARHAVLRQLVHPIIGTESKPREDFRFLPLMHGLI